MASDDANSPLPDPPPPSVDRGSAGASEPAAAADSGPPEGDSLPDGIRQRLEAMVPEMVKRTFAAGLGALFQTEEGLRRLAKDVQMPDVAGYIANSADATKDRVLEVIGRETREFLEKINLADEVARVLTMLSFEIRTEVRFIPNSERMAKVEPDVKTSVRLKRAGRDTSPPGSAPPSGKGDESESDERGGRRRFWRRTEGRDRDDSDEPES